MRLLCTAICFIYISFFSFCSGSCKKSNSISKGNTPTDSTAAPVTGGAGNNPVTTDSNIVVITVDFDGSASGVSSTIPLLKYNKKKCVSIQFDDANRSALSTLDKFQSLTYTDGCGNKIHYSSGLAVNGRNSWNNSELGLDALQGVTYDERKDLINKGWDILNHGYYHNDGYDGSSNLYSNGKDALKNIADLDTMISSRMHYKMNCLVVPTNFYGYMLGAKQYGYIGATSSNTFDGLQEPEFWDGWNKPKKLSVFSGLNFTAIQREFAENQWNPTDYPWIFLQSTIDFSGECYMTFGTHSMNSSEESYFRQWMDKIASMGDNVMMTSMREFLEYEHIRYNVIKTESTSGNTLTIKLDYSKIPNKNISWKDLSLIIGGKYNIKSVTCDNATFILSYNTSSRLVNIKNRKIFWN